MKKLSSLLVGLCLVAFLKAQTNPEVNIFNSPGLDNTKISGNIQDDQSFYANGHVTEFSKAGNIEQGPIESNPPYKWIYPKPFGTSMGVVKVIDATTVHAFGSSGTFVETRDAGQTFNLNPFAGVPLGAPYNTTYDIYGAHYFDQNKFYLCGALGVTKTLDGGQTFNAVGTGSIASGTARDIYFLNDTVGYIVGTGTIRMMKTTDAGNSWTMNSLLPSTTYYGLKVFNENKILVGGSTSSSANIRITTDAGSTWNTFAAGTGTVYSFAFFDSLLGFAASNSGRGYKTTDGGFTWNQMTSMNAPTSSTFYDVFIKGTGVYFVEDDSLLFVTADSGATFSTKRYLPLGKPTQIMRAGDYNGNDIWVVGDNGYFFKSTDNGNTWSTQSEVSASGFIQGIWGDQTGKIIAVGTNSPNQVLVSDNFGNSFTPVALSVSAADLRGIFMHNATSGYAVGSGGRIWKTTDGGYNWNLSPPTPVTNQAFRRVRFINNNFGMVSGNGGKIFKTTDGGTNWIDVSNTGSTVGVEGLAVIDDTTALVAQGTFVYRTTNGGTNWTMIDPGVPSGSGATSIVMLNKTVGYLVGSSSVLFPAGYIFKTTNGGLTWAATNFPFSSNLLYNINYRSEFDYVVVGQNGGVFHTTDGGANWNQYNLGLPIGQVIGLTSVHRDTIIVGGNTALVKVALNPPTSPTLNVTALIEGFYNGTSMVSDTVKVQLRNSSAPYSVLEEKNLIVDTLGNTNSVFSSVDYFKSFYIALKHRNALETWSKSPMSFIDDTLAYDFTTAATQAYGDNMILKGTKWTMFGGDVNQDGVIDISDVGLVDNDNLNFVTGYTSTDVTGDNLVDLSDVGLVDNNNLNFVSRVTPFLLKSTRKTINQTTSKVNQQ